MAKAEAELKENGRPDWSDVARWADKEREEAERRNARRGDIHAGTFSHVEQLDLTDMKTVIDFEEQWGGSREYSSQILQQFKVGITRYRQVLNNFIGTREALAYNPILVSRLVRIRDRNLVSRLARNFG